MDNRIKKFDLIFFLSFSNYILISYILCPVFYEKLGRNMYQIPIIMGIIGIIIFLLLPKINYIGLKEILKTKVIKYILVLFDLIEFFILIKAFSNSMSYFYDFLYQDIIFYFGVFMVIVFLSKCGFGCIFRISPFMFLIAIILLFIPIISSYKSLDFNFLKPLSFDFDIVYLYYLVIPMDFIRIYILNDYCKEKIKKTTLIKGFSIFNLFVLIYFLLTIFAFGNYYLLDYKYIGYVSFRIQTTFNYVGQMDIVYMFLIILICCFKGAYLFNSIRILLKIKMKKNIFYFYVAIMFILGFYIVKNCHSINKLWIIVLIFLGIVVYFYFLYANRRIKKCMNI